MIRSSRHILDINCEVVFSVFSSDFQVPTHKFLDLDSYTIVFASWELSVENEAKREHFPRIERKKMYLHHHNNQTNILHLNIT